MLFVVFNFPMNSRHSCLPVNCRYWQWNSVNSVIWGRSKHLILFLHSAHVNQFMIDLKYFCKIWCKERVKYILEFWLYINSLTFMYVYCVLRIVLMCWQVLNRPENCTGLPEYQVRQIAHDTSAAVEYLHSQRVIHRDIKPENIVMTNGGKQRVSRSRTHSLALYLLLKGSFHYTLYIFCPTLLEINFQQNWRFLTRKSTNEIGEALVESATYSVSPPWLL